MLDFIFNRKKEKTETPKEKKHDTAFLSEVNSAIQYASSTHKDISCVFVDFRDEKAMKEFYGEFVTAFHANNGNTPSNEARMIGKCQIGAVIYAPNKNVCRVLEEIIENFKECLPVGRNTIFKAGIGGYEEGDTRRSLLKKAQEYIAFDFDGNKKDSAA